MISVRNIVSVDLDIVNSSKTLGGFNTVVYITNASLNKDGDDTIKQLLINSVEDLENYVSGATSEAVIASARNYFENGGNKLLIVVPSGGTLTSFKEDIANARKITNDFAYVCISNSLVDNDSYYFSDEFISIAKYCSTSKAPEKLRLLVTTNRKDFIQNYGLEDTYTVVKYCTKTVNNTVIDAALLVGAYFSKIDLNGSNTIKDYSYTAERLIGIAEKDYAENISQEDFEEMINNANNNGYYNVIDAIGSKIVNFGGDLASNERISIHTDFGAMAVERDITYSVLETMIGKQYLTEQGMSNIKAAINSQLQRYKTNGYLNTGARYSGEDLVIKYNGRTYDVIKNGTTLTQGYYLYSVPVSDISTTDKVARKFTPLYVILETQSGARVIEITGEVRA